PQHKQPSQHRRCLRQQRRPGPRTERRLAAAAAEGRSHVPPALLQQDDRQQQQANNYIERREQIVENHVVSRNPDYSAAGRLLVTIATKLRTSKLAPPTSAPSTSGSAIKSRILSGLTLPP